MPDEILVKTMLTQFSKFTVDRRDRTFQRKGMHEHVLV